MSAKKVKCWIKSRNRMETRRRFGRTKAPSIHARRKSAYCTFLSEYMAKEANKSQQSRKDLLKSAGEAWRKIKANKTSFNNYNLAASKKNASDKKLSQHQMKPWQNKVVKEMQVLCEKLEEQNCEAFVAVVNSDGELITAGTDMAKNFMQREDLFLQRFGLAVSGKEQFACKSKDSWDDLRCKVQEIFNEKFCKYVNYNKFFTVDSKAEQLRPCGEILYVYCHFSVHGM
ncbi:uncharacterized protein [Apostichopus japonicus]|uniref:uncharacterized protein isoform X2 n=1 Tax=Stichopus japonicus TaxID=307972 RepID=UPI003AB911E3